MLDVVDAPASAPVAAPVAEARRIRLIDALRGVAVLGILLMNIPGFAMPNYYSEAFRSDPTNVNFWVDAVVSVLFEGKMRALFGMLFGAGVILFTSTKGSSGRSVAGLFYRRMGWLLVFGLIHAHLILWVGEILYLYGVCGMLVYLFRNVNPKYLALGVPLVAVVDFGSGAAFHQYMRVHRLAYVDAHQAEVAGRPLTAVQVKALDDWRSLEKSIIPNRQDAAENTRKMKSGYATVASYIRPLALKLQTVFVPFLVWDSVALMLLGMALYRWGFLTGGWSTGAYLRTLLVGYGLGLPLAAYSFYHGYSTAPNLEAQLARLETVPIEWTGLIYPFQRILLVMAHVATLILLYRGGYAARLFRCLEAVGQMALTDYILESVFCTLIFFGYGLNYFAELQYYQLFFVVAGIWAVLMLVSPLWLRSFRFGPLEWVWRSLTYWRLQPFRRGPGPNPAGVVG